MAAALERPSNSNGSLRTTQTAIALFETLKKDFHTTNPDIKKCGQHLATLKMPLNYRASIQTGEILEIGAEWSVKAKDIPSFERYISQLKTYYNDYSTTLPPSQRQYPLLGLNLLRLLAQNRIAEFHTELELVDPEQLAGNVYVKHPVAVEQSLMEGSYNRVWRAKRDVPGEEYLFFMDMLMGTIRNEIGSCIEKAYEKLPVADAATLLYLHTPKEVADFSVERGWNVQGNQIIFVKDGGDNHEIPAPKIIRHALGYARELERIV
ncbi:COP9 signalosome [Chytriomyces sp. MP71]|nr:COP9 signalosome [Chytriomyces sp. MP71]